MTDIAIALLVFVCFYGSALAGMRLRPLLPENHLTDDSKHVLEVGLGIIGTVSGLVLGLLVAAASGSYNAERDSVIDLSSKIVLLDRGLSPGRSGRNGRSQYASDGGSGNAYRDVAARSVARLATEADGSLLSVWQSISVARGG